MTAKERRDYYDNHIRGRKIKDDGRIYTLEERVDDTVWLSWTHKGGGTSHWGLAELLRRIKTEHSWALMSQSDMPESYQIY